MERIGFIGLGAMGRPMARNLLRGTGAQMIVYDMNPDAVAALVAEGATAGGSIAEVAANADIIVTMLPDSPDVEAVVLGPGGLADSASAEILVMDMSTIDPSVTDLLSKALGERGHGFVDAPVGRTVTFAEQGKSLFMVGASSNDFGRVKPLLFAMMHFNALSFLPLFLLGMLLCRSYERTGNILVPIGFHALFNANNIGLLILQGSHGLTEELVGTAAYLP